MVEIHIQSCKVESHWENSLQTHSCPFWFWETGIITRMGKTETLYPSVLGSHQRILKMYKTPYIPDYTRTKPIGIMNQEHSKTLLCPRKYTWLSSASQRESTCFSALVDSKPRVANWVAAPFEIASGFLQFGAIEDVQPWWNQPLQKLFFLRPTTQIFTWDWRIVLIFSDRSRKTETEINDGREGQIRYLIMLLIHSKHSEQRIRENDRTWLLREAEDYVYVLL